MEKLNNENNVSRETIENEVKLVFKNRCGDIITIHKIEGCYVERCIEKSISYIIELLKIYKVDGYVIIYVNDKWEMMIDIKSMKKFGLAK